MKKDYSNYILYLILALLLVSVFYSVMGFSFNNSNKQHNKNEFAITEPSFKSITTGTTDQGDVSVELTPHKVTNGKLEVDISANTHSVDLSQFNLEDITTLGYNEKVIKPLSATTLKGHHASGTLVFGVDKDIEKFTIRIKGLPKLEERVFKWGE